MSTLSKPLDFAKPHVLRNPREYRAAVAEIDDLLDRDPRKDSEDHERLEFLSVLVEAYEDAHVPALPKATPQEVVDYVLEQRGMTRADLTRRLGSRSRVSEFFARKRRLSLGQIEALRSELGIPADLLIG